MARSSEKGLAASENVFRAPKRYTNAWVALGLDNHVVGVGVGHAAAGGKVTVKIHEARATVLIVLDGHAAWNGADATDFSLTSATVQ